jgi:3-isopropylmalate/(R)-2-methylmalate dehydratase small subunit
MNNLSVNSHASESSESSSSNITTPNCILTGNAWTFGDDINTDIIIPFKFKSRTNDPYEMAKYAMYGVDQEFHNKISKGDFIVAGKNFGGGSSREQAPVALKYAGISAVVAESFARIFYRNSFAIGLPALEVPEIRAKITQGDELRIDITNFKVENSRTKDIFSAKPVRYLLREMLLEGGLVEYYKKNKRFPWAVNRTPR